jgi:hypothetical protein
MYLRLKRLCENQQGAVFGCDRGPESRGQTLFFALAEAARLGN